MKKTISLFCVFALLAASFVVTLIPNWAKASAAVAEADQLAFAQWVDMGYEYNNAGGGGGGIWMAGPDSDLSVTKSASLTGISDYWMLKIKGASALTGNLWDPDASNVIQFTDNWDCDLTGTNALMFYVKMPETDGGVNAKLLYNMVFDESKWAYVYPHESVLFYTLAQGKTRWESRSASAAWELALPGGFEGWVRIPWGSFATDSGWISAPAVDAQALTGMRISFDNFGGTTYGDAYIGAFIAATNEVLSKDGIILDGGDKIQNLFTGTVITEEELFAPPSDIVTTADQIEQGAVVKQAAETGLTSSGVTSLTGISDYQMLKVGGASAFEGVYDVWGGTGKNIFKIDCKDYIMDGTNAFMFYVRMPGTTGSTSALKFQLFLNGGAESVQLADAPPLLYALPKNTTVWEKIGHGYPDLGLKSWQGLTLPGGFEGWIRIPWSAFYRTVMNSHMPEKPTGYSLDYLAFSFDYVGGEYGDGYLGALMTATNGIMSKNGAMIDDRGIIQNLFTGEEMAESEVLPDPLQPGDVVDFLPEPTTNKTVYEPGDDDITDKSVKLAWEALSGAVSYRVELYERAFGNEGLLFTYVGSYTAPGTDTILSGLKPVMWYSAVVYALDANGNEIAVYEAVSFFTKSGNDTQSVTEEPDDNEEAEDLSKSPDTGVDSKGTVIALFIFALMGVVSAFKKKTVKRGEW